jgi:tRNA threonylcarbamoyl adenosine modification protein YeaZ
MKTTLAIDSTSDILSISICKGPDVLSEIKDDKSIRHMVNIISDIDYVLKKAGKTIKDIELFAINLGPGDFTGGRIGISVIKIFAMLSGHSVLGFNSLDVFSVGCMLKNIGCISKKISCSAQVYIIPAMDVRNSEIYFGIYEVSKSDNEKVIFSFDFNGNRYFLSRKSDGFLVKSDCFNKKISQVIENAKQSGMDNCFSSGEIINENNSKKCLNLEEITDNKNGYLKLDKDFFILTANALETYSEMFENLKREILLNRKEIEIISDEKNIHPSSEYVSFLAGYSYSNSLKSLPLIPVYVRDFIAFSKK